MNTEKKGSFANTFIKLNLNFFFSNTYRKGLKKDIEGLSGIVCLCRYNYDFLHQLFKKIILICILFKKTIS